LSENFKIRDELNAVGPWNKDTPADTANRGYFSEFVDVVVKALSQETFSHRGKYGTSHRRGWSIRRSIRSM
jgi:hypothetical protein